MNKRYIVLGLVVCVFLGYTNLSGYSVADHLFSSSGSRRYSANHRSNRGGYGYGYGYGGGGYGYRRGGGSSWGGVFHK